MLRPTWPWLVFLVFFVTGCTGSSSTSTVNSDGTWTRTIKLATRDGVSVGGGKSTPKLTDIFKLPVDKEWTRTDKQINGEFSTTLSRKMKIDDAPLTDIVIKDKKGTQYKNFVLVRKLDGNRWEYYEKVIFVGDASKRDSSEWKQIEQEVKAALPKGIATEEDIKEICSRTETAMIRQVVGPDDHLFGLLIINVDGARRRFRSKFAVIEERVLAEVLGNRLTEDEREKAIKTMLAKLDKKGVDETFVQTTSTSGSANSTLVGISSVVKLPGKILETNGTVDEYTGEIYWDFTSTSADAGVIELRAVCQMP